MPADHAHEDYLWGNGALAAALALVRTELGVSSGFEADIGDLPAFTCMEDGTDAETLRRVLHNRARRHGSAR